MQACDVSGPVGIVEDVEQRAVEDGVVTRAVAQLHGVGDRESRVDASPGRVVGGLRDGVGREIDPEDVIAEPGQQHRVFAGAATHVEHLAAKSATALQVHDGRLRFADHPRRGAGLVGFIEQGEGRCVVHTTTVQPRGHLRSTPI